MANSICCVDDNDGCRKAVTMLLGELGFEVIQFSSAEAFLASNQLFDQIILDLKLPGLSGLQLLQKLRDWEDATPVVLCSGSVSVEEMNTAKSLPNVAVLRKPFKIGELTAMLDLPTVEVW